jgi:hypothetical protein
MQRAAISLLTWMACINAAGAGFAEEPLVRYNDRLRCGRVTARLRTTCVEPLSMGGWDCVSQSLRLIRRDGVSNDVPLDIRRVPSSIAPERKALDGHVEAWTCVRSQSGQDYVSLLYVCQRLGECGTLSPSEERNQIVDQAGHVVAGGRHGSDPGALERLGLQ